MWSLTIAVHASQHLRDREVVDLAAGLHLELAGRLDVVVGWTRRTAPGAVAARSGISLGIGLTVARVGASFARVTGLNALGAEEYFTLGRTSR